MDARATLPDLLAEAAALAPRSSPAAAWAAAMGECITEWAAARAAGGGGGGPPVVVCDVRSSEARARQGVIAASLHVPATVLLWRLEPGGAWRSPHVPEGARVVVVCDHGCASLLLAGQLRRMVGA